MGGMDWIDVVLGLENTKWDGSIVLCAIESKVHSRTNHEGLERGAEV